MRGDFAPPLPRRPARGRRSCNRRGCAFALQVLSLAAGQCVAYPLSAGAQQKTMPVIGFLSSRTPGDSAGVVAAFRQGLAETGYVEGQNVAIEYRWAEGRYNRLPAFADDLVGRNRFDRRKRRPPFRMNGEKRDLDDPDGLHRPRRPGWGRSGRQPRGRAAISPDRASWQPFRAAPSCQNSERMKRSRRRQNSSRLGLTPGVSGGLASRWLVEGKGLSSNSCIWNKVRGKRFRRLQQSTPR